MAIIDQHTQANLYVPHGLEGVRFPFGQDEIAIEYADREHPEFDFARVVEHETFVELGDRPAIFPSPEDDEFLPYDSSSTIVYARAVEKGRPVTIDSPVVGMNRLIHWSEPLGLKTISDLAAIPFSTQDADAKEKILEALTGQGFIDVKPQQLCPAALERIILRRLCSDNGSCEPQHLIDFATLAPNNRLANRERLSVVSALLGAGTMYLLRSLNELEQYGVGLSHFVQFTDVRFTEFMSKMGYHSEPIAGLKQVLYDTGGDGIAMLANPQISSIESLRQSVAEAKPGSHLGRIALIYKDHFGESV